MHANWNQEDLTAIETMTTFAEMEKLAMRILEKMPQPVVQVCGPISTGGRGSVGANLKMFDYGIQFLINQGKSVFDQRPFEIPMQKIKAARTEPGYATELLIDFYLPLFESGYIRALYFLPGWEASTGARWEHDQAGRLGIKIFYLPPEAAGA